MIRIPEKVFLCSSIEEYGKLISFCIDNDISVWRVYWDDREKGNRCYHINWEENRCYYASKQFYLDIGFVVVNPLFVENFGQFELIY